MRTLSVLLLASASLFGPSCQAAARYNFAYQASGEALLQPLQVFDDGERTYFQFAAKVPPPTISAAVKGKEELLIPERTGQYLVVPITADRFSIHFRSLQAAVVYAGQARAVTPSYAAPPARPLPSPPEAPVLANAVAPSFGAAKPIAGETSSPNFLEKSILIAFPKGRAELTPQAVAQLTRELAAGEPINKAVIVGRNDTEDLGGLGRARAHAIRARLLESGVPLGRITTKEAFSLEADGGPSPMYSELTLVWADRPAIPPDSKTSAGSAASTPVRTQESVRQGAWSLRRGEQSLEQNLKRWAAEAGWRLIWTSAPTVPVHEDQELAQPQFLSAVEFAIERARAAGYPLKATAFNNKVLVVTLENAQ